ncbi:MAG: cytochrome-c oxidase, cbb3-type subunit III [Burkholderiaceae bacterium]
MSDFVSNGWSVFVAGVTALSLIGCLLLLAMASKRKIIPNDPTTGHVWDEDLREYNNPLPRWWVGLFIITVLFAGVYLMLYPGLGSMAGSLGWTSTGQLAAEDKAAREAMAPVYAKYKAMPAADLAKDSGAMGIGERLFLNNCAVCHGSDARGSKGFPNLTDNDWLWGGAPEQIEQSIAKGRTGAMPPMGAAVGSAEDVKNVANYVLSLSGSPHNNVAAEQGKAKFAACAACHGLDGKGNQALGAPNLTDKIWLHGYGEEAIITQINNGKTNVMPAHEARLSAEQIHVLAAWVWSKSNGGTAKP